MNPRINLLKKSEQRYQGAVSQRFILVGMVVTPILFITVLSGVKLLQYSYVRSELKTNRETWQDLEPRLALFRKEQHGLAKNRQTLELFEGWKNSRVPFVELLTEIQDAVPSKIQLTRLSVRSDPGSSVYADAEAVGLSFFLLMDGLSQGNRAENEVIQLPKDLSTCEHLSTTFKSIKLASMRKREGAGGVTIREFKIEAKAEEDAQ